MKEAIHVMLAKADQATASARLLLDAGDVDGACNRAYYAMFGAARAALMDKGHQPELKTHGSVIGAFGLHFVKTGLLARAIGKAINDVQEIRLAADYTASSVSREDTAWPWNRPSNSWAPSAACCLTSRNDYGDRLRSRRGGGNPDSRHCPDHAAALGCTSSSIRRPASRSATSRS